MKSNYKVRSIVAQSIEKATNTVLRLKDLLIILTLHREFGFGMVRLKRLFDDIRETQREFVARASVTDKYDRKKRELSDIETAIIKVLIELRKDGIDHRDILGNDEELVIIDEDGKQTNLDDLLDRIKAKGGF